MIYLQAYKPRDPSKPTSRRGNGDLASRLRIERLARAGKPNVPNSPNDCWRPSAEASKADLREFHQEEMKLRHHRQVGQSTRISMFLEKNSNYDFRNYSRHPKGKKRHTAPVYS